MEYGGRMMIVARIKGVNEIFSKGTRFTHHRGNRILTEPRLFNHRTKHFAILWGWNGAYLAKLVWRSSEFSSGFLVDDIFVQKDGIKNQLVPSGKLLHNYGKSPFSHGFPIKNGGSFHRVLLTFTRPGMDFHRRNPGWEIHPMEGFQVSKAVFLLASCGLKQQLVGECLYNWNLTI